MLAIIHYIIDFVMIFGGLYSVLLGFKVIKIKVTKPEDQKKMEQWHQKFGTMMKILGIVLVVIGIFNLTIHIFNL